VSNSHFLQFTASLTKSLTLLCFHQPLSGNGVGATDLSNPMFTQSLAVAYLTADLELNYCLPFVAHGTIGYFTQPPLGPHIERLSSYSVVISRGYRSNRAIT
jgi:hypothetical protein